jgi:hypothetical protein
MLSVALGLFAVAAAGGVLMVLLRVRNQANPPLGIALLHGALAATALVLLLLQVANGAATGTLPWASTGLFVVAALGGFVLLSIHLSGRTIPLSVVGIHATVAVLGFLLLAAVVLG